MPIKTKSQTKTQLAKLQAKLETRTGESVGVANPEWMRLMKDGVLVRLHIRRWRAKAQIDLQDLGLPQPKDAQEKEIYDELMTLGAKRLLPPTLMRSLDALDSGARKWLDAHAYQTYWGDFIPLGAYDEWKKGNGEYEQKYFAVRDQIKRDWDTIITQLVDAYAIAAHTAYKRLLRLNPNALKLGATRLTEDAFVDAFMARIQNAIPTREQVYNSFDYETELSFIPLPSMLAEDAAKKEEIETKQEQQRAVARMAMQNISERENMMRRMNEDVVREARARKTELANQFVRDLQTQSLGALYDGFVNVLESIQRNGTVIGKSSEQVRNIIDTWRAMNLTGDKDIEAQIGRISGLINKPSSERTAGEVAEMLREIATAARANLVSLGTNPRSARSVGIADKVEPLALRRGSRQVQLELVEE